MRIGIVGHEDAKFTPETEVKARELIRDILNLPKATLVSGHCHLGGIDIWAEQIADAHGIPKDIYPPKTRRWVDGYKPRNIQIAEHSDVVHCIVVAELPASYVGMRFNYCYHCGTNEHIKSGGCWTGKYAKKIGKGWVTHVVR